MDKIQLDLLQAPFSSSDIKQREGSYGKTLDYLETHTVIQRLNNALDCDWDFQVVSWEINQEADEVIVLGKLTAGGVTKMQFGSAKCKRNKQSGELVSIGDDFKSSASDALKKCATLLGVGLQLYRTEEAVTPPAECSAAHPAAQHSEPRPTRQQPAPPHNHSQHQSPLHRTLSHPLQATRPHRQEHSEGSGRISQKQHSYLLKLAGSQGMSKHDLSQHCQHQFGVVLDFISRQDASALIDQLHRGELSYRGGAA